MKKNLTNRRILSILGSMKTIKVSERVLSELKELQAETLLQTGNDYNLNEVLAGVLAVYRLHVPPAILRT
nr:MAG: hypothetical protein [Microviridae sp.]